MIPLNFALFHSGGPLTYLRYLTFKTLRHFHPQSKIQLYVAKECNINGCEWTEQQQDFQHLNQYGHNYLDDLKKLDVEVITEDFFPKYAPNYQADIKRWQWLRDNGGIFLDTDQIILQSFKSLPLHSEFIYTNSNRYFPVGVIGLEKGSPIAIKINEEIESYYNIKDYNCLGPGMLMRIAPKLDLSKSFNAPTKYFYPMPFPDFVYKLYNGEVKVSFENYALHWYAGHPLSQCFNEKYTEELAKTSKDTISVFLRNKEII